MKYFVVIAISLWSLMGAAEVALAQTCEATLAALGKLAAAERQARLAEAAKKEKGLPFRSGLRGKTPDGVF